MLPSRTPRRAFLWATTRAPQHASQYPSSPIQGRSSQSPRDDKSRMLWSQHSFASSTAESAEACVTYVKLILEDIIFCFSCFSIKRETGLSKQGWLVQGARSANLLQTACPSFSIQQKIIFAALCRRKLESSRHGHPRAFAFRRAYQLPHRQW